MLFYGLFRKVKAFGAVSSRLSSMAPTAHHFFAANTSFCQSFSVEVLFFIYQYKIVWHFKSALASSRLCVLGHTARRCFAAKIGVCYNLYGGTGNHKDKIKWLCGGLD